MVSRELRLVAQDRGAVEWQNTRKKNGLSSIAYTQS